MFKHKYFHRRQVLMTRLVWSLGVIIIFSISSVYPQSSIDSPTYVLSIKNTDKNTTDSLSALGVRVVRIMDSTATVIASESQLASLKSNGWQFVIEKPYGVSDTEIEESLTETVVLTLNNGRIIVDIDANGTFTMRRASDGKWILFPQTGTGFFSVNVDGVVFSQGNSTLPVVNSLSLIDPNTASIVYGAGSGINITQLFKLEGDALGLYVSTANASTISRNVKIRYLLDTQIDDNDGSPLYAPPVATRTFETDIPSVNFLNWEAWLTPINPQMKGIGTLADVPTRMVFAWWPNAVNFVWDYTPNPNQRFYTPGFTKSPDSDGCVLLFYDFGTVPAQLSTTPIVTYYGIGSKTSGKPSDEIKIAIQQLRDAMRNYADATASAYAYQSGYAYDVFTETLKVKEFSQGLATRLLNANVNTINQIIQDFQSQNWLGGSTTALRLFLTNLTRALLVNVIPTTTAIMNDINPEDDASTIETKIRTRIYGLNGWDFGQSGKGINALMNDIIRRANIIIPSELPSDFPVDELRLAIIRLAGAIRRATPTRTTFAPETPVYWLIPGDAQLQPFPVSNYLAGSSSSTLRGLQAAVAAYKSLRQIKQIISYACLINNAVKGGTLLLAAPTAGSTAAYEGIYQTANLACQIGSWETDVLLILGQVSLAVQDFDALVKVKSDLDHLMTTYQSALNDVETITNDPSRLNTDYNASRLVTVSTPFVPDVRLGVGQKIGSGIAKVALTNQSIDKSASAFAAMSIYGTSNDPIGLFYSQIAALPPQGKRDLEIPFELPNNGIFGLRYYSAVFSVVSSAGVENKVAPSFKVCGAIGCFIDNVSQVLSTTLNAGQTASQNVNISSTTRTAQFMMAFPGSDFDLHVYDQSGNHVGVNYGTGAIDLQISGASYSGAGTNPERIIIDQPRAGSLRVEVVAVSSDGPENCEVALVQESNHPATLIAVPDSVLMSVTPSLDTLSTLVILREIGGHNSVQDLSIKATALTSPQGQIIPSSNVNVNLTATSIIADSSIAAAVSLIRPANTPPGRYSGQIEISSSANAVVLPIRVEIFSTSAGVLVSSLNPDRGQVGQTLDVTITGANFANGAAVSFSGTGITVNSTTFVNATQLKANISIDANAAAGSRDVIVRNPDGKTATGTGLFSVEGCSGVTTVVDHFDNGFDNWLPKTNGSWGINVHESNNVLCLGVPNSSGDEYVLLRDEPWLNFDWTLKAKSDDTQNHNFFILFGVTDFNNAAKNGYYLQFLSGGVRLYRSIGGGRGVEIAFAAGDFATDTKFHTIRIERALPHIQISVDGRLLISKDDGTFAIGSIGFGSFNSLACFDDVQITGTRADPSFYIDAFDDGDADGWSPLTPSRWQVGNESGSLRYFINTTNYEPPNSARLGELSVLSSKSWDDFVFECHAKSADAVVYNENADLCLVFGYQDFDSYYYVNFNTAPGLTQLFRTHNGVNTALATYNQSTFPAGDVAYHALRIERTGTQIRAFFDGIQVLAAIDSFFGAGQIGIGSYNDSGYFDNVAVTGGCPAPSNKVSVTFQVNMAVQICENKFKPGTDPLSVRGSFNGFVDGVDVLEDHDGDGIYTTTVEFDATMVGTTIEYKYSFTHAGQTVVESVPNRQFTIPSGGGTVTLEYFNHDNVCNRSAPIFPIAASLQQVAGNEFTIDIMIGDNANPVSNLFGVSFELSYTNTTYIDVVTPTSTNVTPGPFLGNDVIFVSNVDESAGNVSIGISRKSSQGGVNGSGVVARIKLKSLASTPHGTSVVFDLRNVMANDPAGNVISLTSSLTTITITSGIIVWPGDTNNDRIANQVDVLPLGVYWNQTGPRRPNASTAWIGQPATPWTPAAATYADANGDSVVNQADVLAIGLNFGRTHSASHSIAVKSDDTSILNKSNAATIGTTIIGDTNPGKDFDVNVVVDQVTNLLGVSFELLYSPTTLVDPQSAESGSFLGNDVIFFPSIDKNAGKISIGVTRKASQGGVSGSGAVAKIKMRVSSQALKGQAITLTLQNAAANDPDGASIQLSITPSTPVVVSVTSRRNKTLPTAFALYANTPNPFNPSTEISYDLPELSEVHIEIFDVLGKRVRMLVSERQPAGSYYVIWDGRDENGQTVASGVFIYQLRAGKFVQSRKMLLLR